MKPLISVIIPSYNPNPKILLKCLDSIFAQTYDNLQVILVDDGSQTPVEDILKSYPNFLDKIEIIRQKNSGAPTARNKGFELAKGEFVIFWDDDLVGSAKMLEKMFVALKNNSFASFAYSNFYFGAKKMFGCDFSAEKLRKINYITTTSLIRKSDFPKFDESLKRFQDWDLWLTMAESNKKGIFVPEFLFKVYTKKIGISSWLPSFAYKNPWKKLPFWKQKVEKYEKAKEILFKKHRLY